MALCKAISGFCTNFINKILTRTKIIRMITLYKPKVLSVQTQEGRRHQKDSGGKMRSNRYTDDILGHDNGNTDSYDDRTVDKVCKSNFDEDVGEKSTEITLSNSVRDSKIKSTCSPAHIWHDNSFFIVY